MFPTRRCTVFAAGVLLGLTLAACETTPSGQTQPAAGPSPVNQRELDRQAAWTEAIAGLDFSTGLVVVENPPVAANPARAREMMTQGHEAMNSNHRVQAVKAYADAVRADPDMPEAYYRLGEAMTARGKTDMAIACFRTVTKMQPENTEAHFELAMALSRDSRHEEAIDAMSALLDLDPANGPAHERLAIWYSALNDYGSAWEHVHAAQAAGHGVPPQLINRLSEMMADPAAR